MHTQRPTVLLALGALLLSQTALAQNAAPAPKPAPAPPAPAPPAPAPPPPAPAPRAPAPAPAPAAPAPAPAPRVPAAAPVPNAESPAEVPPSEAEAPPGEEAGGEVVEPAAEPPAAPAPAAPLPPQSNPFPAWPEPAADAAALRGMGRERPTTVKRNEETDVFAEDWWTHARPILELHGDFRVRAELFYRFSLGRIEAPEDALWPRPADSVYTINGGSLPDLNLCTQDEAGIGSSTSTDELVGCVNNTQAGANLRFRLNPELHVSDNLRVISQIDLLDNLVLGSTPSGFSVSPSATGYQTNPRNGYAPTGFEDQTTNAPRSGINSFRDSVEVKRAWAEYSTPVGELRFGRMPNHWGLGMVYNSGDGYDDDYQSTIDRIQFVAGIKPLELYISGAWDFPNEGATSDATSRQVPQPYDAAQLDDVDQYVFSVARKKSPELQRLSLTRGDLILNGGVQLTYRKQLLASDPSQLATATTTANDCGNPGPAGLGCAPSNSLSFVRRDAHYWLPNLWVQLLYKQFRFEAEAATVQGSIRTDNGRFNLRQWGLVTEIEQLLVENRLHLGFGFGWASGDPDVEGITPNTETSANFGQIGDRTVSTFRFNPAYRVDLILYRHILSRVQGTYYFRPNLGYDFMRDATGQRIGGRISGVWSRASEFVQSPGHDRDLGVELNAALYFQSKDGALNDNPGEMGGFYARLEYGVLFPMAGLGYPDAEAARLNSSLGRGDAADISSAQTLRLYLGVLF